jgi:hypothetical protein
MQGPNVKKLIVHKMSLLMIPPGCKNPLETGLTAIANLSKDVSVVREATDWVKEALSLVRSAAEPNPWKTADDEAIAGEILKGIESRKRDLHGRVTSEHSGAGKD